MKTTKEQRAAYHEAGHAIIAHHAEYLPKTRQIKIGDYGDAFGICSQYEDESFRPNDFVPDDAEAIMKIEGQIIFLYAGLFAEKRFSGRFNRLGAESDQSKANELLEVRQFSKKVVPKYMAFCRAIAEEQVNVR